MKRKRKHINRTASTEGEQSLGGAVRCAICGMLISLAAAIALLSILTVFSLARPDPEGLMLAVASVLPYPCAILGGFICTKIGKASPAAAAAIYCGMTVILSVAMFPLLPSTYEHGISALSFFTMRALLIGCCISGTLLGAMSPSGNKRHRHRKR